MSASEASTFEQLFLESNDQKRTADLRQGVVSVDYYEDILSPTITAKIRVINTGDSIAPKDSQNPEKTDGAKQSDAGAAHCVFREHQSKKPLKINIIFWQAHCCPQQLQEPAAPWPIRGLVQGHQCCSMGRGA